jgi:hypothetical protein
MAMVLFPIPTPHSTILAADWNLTSAPDCLDRCVDALAAGQLDNPVDHTLREVDDFIVRFHHWFG